MTEEKRKGGGPYEVRIAGLLDIVESAIYLLVAIFLIIMALVTFFIVAKDMASLITGPIEETLTIDGIHVAMSDLLIILVIAELIQTVIVYIYSHQLDLKLILAAGLTALIRRVMVFGVESIGWEEMAVTAFLILILVYALKGDGRVSLKWGKKDEGGP